MVVLVEYEEGNEAVMVVAQILLTKVVLPMRKADLHLLGIVAPEDPRWDLKATVVLPQQVQNDGCEDG